MITTQSGELIATLHPSQVAKFERDELAFLAGRIGSPQLRGFLQSLVKSIDDREVVHLFTVAPEPTGEWDGFESQRDMLAAMLYNARAQSMREMTPERWARVKRDFRGSANQCLEQADIELEDM